MLGMDRRIVWLRKRLIYLLRQASARHICEELRAKVRWIITAAGAWVIVEGVDRRRRRMKRRMGMGMGAKRRGGDVH